MRSWVYVTGAGFLLCGMPLAAQTSFQVLEQDLQQAKQQHDDAASQFMTTFLGTLEAASQSPSQALDLYKTAGGSLPDASPVTSHYDYETPTERAIREARDAQNFGSAAIVIEVHCGLMRYAALLTVTPTAQGLNSQWIAWLKTTADIYPQMAGKRALKDVAMRDSVITNYLGFHGWAEGDPGKWAIRDIPQLYRDKILEPARNPPTAATLDLWDTYIAMRQADEPDRKKWSDDEEPVLDFDRSADDFAIQPSMEKLGTLDAIIKANPSHTSLDNWIARMRQMIRTYRNGNSSTTTANQLPGATPSTPSSEVGGSTAAATPGSPGSGGGAATPSATPGSPSSGGGAATPTASPGSPSSGGNAETPTASPGSPSSGGSAATPTASPGTPSSGGGSPTPAQTPAP